MYTLNKQSPSSHSQPSFLCSLSLGCSRDLTPTTNGRDQFQIQEDLRLLWEQFREETYISRSCCSTWQGAGNIYTQFFLFSIYLFHYNFNSIATLHHVYICKRPVLFFSEKTRFVFLRLLNSVFFSCLICFNLSVFEKRMNSNLESIIDGPLNLNPGEFWVPWYFIWYHID